MKGKKKEAGKRKLFVCFRPSSTLEGKPAGSKSYYELETEREKRQLLKEKSSVTREKSRSGANGDDRGGEEMDKAWGKGEPVFAYISLDSDGNKYVIQTPAQILTNVDSSTSKRRKVRQAFAKVFNAIVFRDSVMSNMKGAKVRERSSSDLSSRSDCYRSVARETHAKLTVPDRRKVDSRTPSFTYSSLSTSSSLRSGLTASSSDLGEPRRVCASAKRRRACISPTCAGLGLYLLFLSILSIMMLWGRLCAILWTSSWLYLITPLRLEFCHLRAPTVHALQQVHDEIRRRPAGAEWKKNKKRSVMEDCVCV